MAQGKIELIGDCSAPGQSVYLSLPAHPGRGMCGCVKESIDLSGLIKYNNDALEINIDIDDAGQVIGIELIRYDTREEGDDKRC